MAISMPTSGQILAAGRNVASFAAGAVALGVFGKAIDPQKLADGINAISTQLATIAAALAALWAIIGPYWAAWKASRAQRVKSVEASPTEHVVTTDPAVKAASPASTLAPPTAGSITVKVPVASAAS